MDINLDKIVSVSGDKSLYSLVSNKKSGLILEDLKDGKKRFFSAMRHQFSPLGTISIYTTRDTMPLEHVFRNMLQQYEDNPPVDPTADEEELVEYFLDIVPDYDESKVFTGDIKKVLKWFHYLDELDYFSDSEEEE